MSRETRQEAVCEEKMGKKKESISERKRRSKEKYEGLSKEQGMEIKKISRGQMPPANKYVLIYLPDRPWRDDDDELGKWWRVAKCVYGISKAERAELARRGSYRAQLVRIGDEDGKNQRPYCFQEFGGNSYRGQEVDIWCELPVVEPTP